MISNTEKKKQIDWTDRFSYTQISSYLNCPRQYWFNYRAKAPKGTDEGRLLGTAIHSGIASILEIKKKEKVLLNITDVFLRNSTSEAKTALEHDWANLPSAKRSITRHEIASRFESMVRAWAIEILPILSPDKIEEPFAIEYDGIKIGGFIDLVDKRKGVIDWKCTTSRKEKNLEHSLQLALYAHVTGENKVGFGSILKPNARIKDIRKWEPKVYLDTTTLLESQKEWAMSVIVEVARAIQEDKSFVRCSPESFLCREEYCDFWALCRGADKTTFLMPGKEIQNTRKEETKEIRVDWLSAFDYVPEPSWVSPIESPW